MLLAAVGLALGWRLDRGGAREASPGRRLWGASFGAAALGAALGALRHGWGHGLPRGVEHGLWLATALAIAAASALLLAGSAVACSRGGLRRALLLLSGLRFAGLAIWTASHQEYLALAVDATLGAALVVGLLARAARRGEFRGLRPVLAAVALGLCGALARQLGLAPHPHFNENDLYHVIQAASLYLLYRGGRELGGESVVASAP